MRAGNTVSVVMRYAKLWWAVIRKYCVHAQLFASLTERFLADLYVYHEPLYSSSHRKE